MPQRARRARATRAAQAGHRTWFALEDPLQPGVNSPTGSKHTLPGPHHATSSCAPIEPPTSVRPDASLPGNRLPSPDCFPDLDAELIRGRGQRLHSHLQESLDDVGLLHNAGKLVIKPIDDLGGGAGRSKNAVPRMAHNFRVAQLHHCWNFAPCAHALVSCHCQRLELPAAQLAIDRTQECEIYGNLSAKNVLERLPGVGVWDVQHLDA